MCLHVCNSRILRNKKVTDRPFEFLSSNYHQQQQQQKILKKKEKGHTVEIMVTQLKSKAMWVSLVSSAHEIYFQQPTTGKLFDLETHINFYLCVGHSVAMNILQHPLSNLLEFQVWLSSRVWCFWFSGFIFLHVLYLFQPLPAGLK